MIRKVVSVTVELSPQELASGFADMDEDGHALFFNELASITGEWEYPLCFQLAAVTDNSLLTEEGRRVMELIGEYGPKG